MCWLFSRLFLKLLVLQHQKHQRSSSLNLSLERQREDTIYRDDRRRASQPPPSDQQQRATLMQNQMQTMLMQHKDMAGMMADFVSTTMNTNHLAPSQGSIKSSSAYSRAYSSNSGIRNFYNPKSKKKSSDEESGKKEELPPQQITSFQAASQMTTPLIESLLNQTTSGKDIENDRRPHETHVNKKTKLLSSQVVLTNEEVLQLVTKLPVEERIVFITKQSLGGGKNNGFTRVISSMQRMKRQRARQTTTGGAELDDGNLKKKTFNGRFAKKIHSDLEIGLQYTNMMAEVLRSVLRSIDPENPLLSIPLPSVFNPEETTQPTDEFNPNDRQHDDKIAVSIQAAASSGTKVNTDPETAAGGKFAAIDIRRCLSTLSAHCCCSLQEMLLVQHCERKRAK